MHPTRESLIVGRQGKGVELHSSNEWQSGASWRYTEKERENLQGVRGLPVVAYDSQVDRSGWLEEKGSVIIV